ncbi:6-phosphogluconolactonase [Luteipulveratus mongoliensis]|uniref:6-phosphogluconolactonase n=1 Tax=Luteipulveratus mongoliensis TaxID=571913 RepID=A0A0K1JJC1_9MICO|nr:6-phosphogluconolactonase [Luteipulveratus mongoliensis]AKU16807.1 6-phosphogluconolactonase [Luteipulveratus mongoliensis]
MSGDEFGAPEIVRRPDKATLSAQIAGRLVDRILTAQRDRGVAHVVLTGGSMGSASLEALGASGRADEIDWSAVEIWWGDERFVPFGDGERNEVQARQALLDRLPLDPARVHPMAASDEGVTTEDGAARYADQLATAAGDGETVPAFDVLMLGVGPDAHVASLFPGHPALDIDATAAVAIHDSPKPPPDRISMTYPTLNAAREVWLMVAGADKADAVARALGGADRHQAPAAGVHGTDATVWWLDDAAAAQLT